MVIIIPHACVCVCVGGGGGGGGGGEGANSTRISTKLCLWHGWGFQQFSYICGLQICIFLLNFGILVYLLVYWWVENSLLLPNLAIWVYWLVPNSFIFTEKKHTRIWSVIVMGPMWKSPVTHSRPQIYNNNTRLQCARCACSLGTWLTRPFHGDWQQSVFIYGRSYQILSVKASSPASL